MTPNETKKHRILKLNVDITFYENVCEKIFSLADMNHSAYICAANVHMCMESFDNPDFKKIIDNAEIVIPDGAPLAWALKSLGHRSAIQIRGTDLMLKICQEAEKKNIPIGFYGGTEECLKKLVSFMEKKFPNLMIEFHSSPPFRSLTLKEKEITITNINSTGVRILFVGLGCPKQEKWMADHMNKLSCVMIGVGAAFDFVSGTKKKAPRFIQKIGMEWFFRLISEPKRLWKRYLMQNPRFIVFFIRQWFREKIKKAHASKLIT